MEKAGKCWFLHQSSFWIELTFYLRRQSRRWLVLGWRSFHTFWLHTRQPLRSCPSSLIILFPTLFGHDVLWFDHEHLIGENDVCFQVDQNQVVSESVLRDSPNLSFVPETDVNNEEFQRVTDGQALGADGVYDARKVNLSYYPDKKDCLFMTICNETGGDDCGYPSALGQRWFNDPCDGVDGSLTYHFSACRFPKGDLDIDFGEGNDEGSEFQSIF